MASMDKPANHHQISTSTTMVPLKDLGISNNQSSRWQKEAKVNGDVFEEYIRESNNRRRWCLDAVFSRFDPNLDLRTCNSAALQVCKPVNTNSYSLVSLQL